MNFEQWLKAVDTIFANRTGLHHDDFPDFLWMDEFEAGSSPAEAFEEFCFYWMDEIPHLAGLV